MEETSGNMAALGAIESQEAHDAQPSVAPVDGEPSAASPAEVAAENAVLQAPEASEMTPNAPETPAATSTEMTEVPSTPREDEAHDEEMKSSEDVVVNLKFLHRERVTLQCPATILVAELKQRVRDAYIQAVEQEQAEGGGDGGNELRDHEPEPASQPLRLIYKGKVLKDDQILATYGFISEDTIHAVFSRASSATTAQTPTSEASPASATAQPDANGGNPPAHDENAGDDVLRYTRFELPPGADIGQFISSVVSSALNAPGDGSNLPTFIFPNIPLGGTSASGSTSAASTTSSTSTSPAAASSAPLPQTGASGTDQGNAPPFVGAAEARRPPTAPATPSGSSLLLNEAAALRRSIPALELAPLSRPQELSTEMYNLGNATREAGDTYLAIHRQLQFIATRFLQENHLTQTERERLRGRVQQLIPVMERLSTLSTSVAQQLSSSPYGNASIEATTSSAPQGQQSASQAAPATTAPSQGSPVVDLISSLLQVASGGQQQSTTAPSTPANELLPNFLGLVAALAGAGQTPPATSPPGGAASTPVSQADGSTEAPSFSFAPISAYPLWSLGYKLQQHLANRPDYLSLSFDAFVGVISSLVIDHITRCCASGIDLFARTAGEEVENAFKKVEEAQGRVYSLVEARYGIVRASLQNLAQICTVAVDEADETRNAKLRSWLRRSCSHLFVEVSENMEARAAAKTTAEVIAHVLTSSPTPRPPFHEAVVARIHQYLESRFSLA